MRPHTPEAISPRVSAFLRWCSLSASPRYLHFTFVSPDYRTGYCLNNCEAEVTACGGGIVYGWMIWEHVALPLIEAEFHAVIRRGGKLVDITPRQDDEQRILFVPDKTRHAQRVDGRSWNTWSNMKLWADALFEESRPIRIIDTSVSTS